MVRGDEKKVETLCIKAVKEKIPVREAMIEGLCKGMGIVGELYERREYFLADLLLSAEAMRIGLNYLLPRLKEEESGGFVGKYVIGAVKGNIHDLGKNVVGAMLRAGGFDVYDLGVDVNPEQFVRKVEEVNAELVGMSVYTSDALPIVREVERALREAGSGTGSK
ncbi:MAG: Dimethylamine corrinoid protein [Candidatus Bathyarchaeota archaeon BA1]|nr:MAG: Dimethylamine corrinoid protein [Candidatus Bathyarchaeota archaeon BA1]